ncbi:MAG: M20/M25/M40 family metallo-hydrolase [Anaerolineaceae bacterium]|jgi:endoglucanase|nr:M20/M25/M40 family metallo-hydrolase [Anaerolineaceae bacterium]MDD4042622.1 M20/M25/M40 family metallo-hydrolase [Anaerolineaceae bacterium]MDD4578847.1 M20/M25/M40 family metallo-hydrolase [Anaerolineaceae bacterium]
MNFDILPFLKSMLSVAGLSGYEAPIRDVITPVWQELSDKTWVSSHGSLHAMRYGEGAEPRPKVMIAAHMDAIGLMVTGIEKEFLRLTQVGGVDPRILPGQMVIVHGTNSSETVELPGMVVMPPAHLLPKDGQKGPLPQKYLLVDVGLRESEVEKLVRVGDVISFATEPRELSGGTLSGHTLDNRASVAAATVALDLLSRRKHLWDVIAVASSQEEVGGYGAKGSAFDVMPDFAIVIDVTFAKGPGGGDTVLFDMGKTITSTWGSCDHPALYDAMQATADEYEIPLARDFAPSGSGTDAYDVQIAQAGIPVVELGIPLRYMHTPVEVVSIKDVKRAGRLMAEFISNLPLDFMNTVRWE